MFYRTIVTGGLVLGLGGFANAADPLVYGGPPEQGHPFFGPTSMVAAHVDVAVGALFGNAVTSDMALIVEGAGRFAMPLANGPFNLEVETIGSALIDSETSQTITAFGAYAHVFHKTPQRALGVVGGIATTYEPWFIVGLEGAWYWNPFSAYAIARYHANADESNESFTHLEAGLWYYKTANHKIGGYLSWERNEWVSSLEAALAGEYRFNPNVSVFGRGGVVAGGVAISDTTSYYLVGGVRFFLDGQDLWTSDGNIPFKTRTNYYQGAT